MIKQKYLTNSDILDLLIDSTDCSNDNQLADYLTKKYSVSISRQQINQFRQSDRATLTHLILREFVKMGKV